MIECGLQNALVDDSGFINRVRRNSLMANLFLNLPQNAACTLIAWNRFGHALWKGVAGWIDGVHDDQLRPMQLCDSRRILQRTSAGLSKVSCDHNRFEAEPMPCAVHGLPPLSIVDHLFNPNP